MSKPYTLAEIGWKNSLFQQIDFNDLESTTIARVAAHHRNQFDLLTEQGEIPLPITDKNQHLCVGDWILLKQQQFYQQLPRTSYFCRKAAGNEAKEQAIAANIDTVFVVTSANHDLNLNRLERYLSLIANSGSEAIVVLSKIDLCDDLNHYTEQLSKLPNVCYISINCLSENSVAQLAPWCGSGNTVAVVGSSGVGKSSLINSLLNNQDQLTGDIREDDSKGRHTTTSRRLLPLNNGGVIIDTPGMRELQMLGEQQGLDNTFSDIESLITRCKFSNCSHVNEPGCAVQAAIHSGEIEPRRLENYQQLKKEQAFNNQSLAERRNKDRSFTKLIKNTQQFARDFKKAR